ncbi:uncharacterized protein LOC117305878 [Asterias rubens]|uniref:uncharacterized protein LOC117305878 n=1 Tax=Asterias rubens TaxID=7604 RepID=UPI001455A997|nr:uncharacterized protein LOC117305878 [Asterias rubens]XP_033646655.1 uncharacterized protein LOC117305878 [Asterias rubens]
MDADAMKEALISQSENYLNPGEEDEPCTSSASQLNAGGASSYDHYQYPTETVGPKRGENPLRNTHQMKSSNGEPTDPNTDRCNNVAVDIERVRPPAPSTVVGMPVMYPRDSDVLPTAILMTFCCPVCGCMAISQARKARRLREAGKYTSSALASDASSWWAWSAALSGCFIILGMALSAMVFMLLKLIQA